MSYESLWFSGYDGSQTETDDRSSSIFRGGRRGTKQERENGRNSQKQISPGSIYTNPQIQRVNRAGSVHKDEEVQK